jgi:multiple sugar transport system permease protein
MSADPPGTVRRTGVLPAIGDVVGRPVTGTPARAGAVSRPAAARRRSRWRGDTPQAVIMLLPIVAALVVLRFYPVATAIRNSFEGPHGLTLENYRFLFGDPQFAHSLLITLIFNAIVNPFQILVALALAVLLTRRLPGRSLLRALIFAPVAMPIPVSAVVWGQLFAQNGAVNGLFRLLGIPAQGFLTSQSEALVSIVILASWIGVGFWMVFLIAGLNEIPTTLYDAASVDGAGPVRRFFSVALPLLRRPLVFVLVADTVANLVLFAPVQILTSGGPLNATDLLMFDIYNEAYVAQLTNIASAETLVLVVISLLIVVVEFRLLRSRV